MTKQKSYHLPPLGGWPRRPLQANGIWAARLTMMVMACLFLSGAAQAWDVSVTRTPTTDPILGCKGEEVSVAVTASLPGTPPAETAECTVSGPTWKWSGDASGTSASSTAKKTFAAAGSSTMTATAEATYTYALKPGKTGTCPAPEVKSQPITINVCVVDPGTVPTSVAVTYNEHIVAPSGTPWGKTTISSSQPVVDITAYFDCTSKTWKCKVTTATADYNIFYRLVPGCTEASVAAATEANYCEMIKCLKGLGSPSTWYMVSAVEAHERQHVKEIKESINPEFATAKATIEGLSVPHVCGTTTAATAATAIKAKAAYTTALTTMRTNWATTYVAIPDPNANTDAAEHAVVDPVIDAIKKKAKDAMPAWAACP